MKCIIEKIEKRIWSRMMRVEIAQNCYSVAGIRTLYNTNFGYYLLTVIWAALYNLSAR